MTLEKSLISLTAVKIHDIYNFYHKRDHPGANNKLQVTHTHTTMFDRSQNVVDALSWRQSFRQVWYKSAVDCMRNANKFPKIPNSTTVKNKHNSLRPVVRVAPPDTATDRRSNNNESFPDPQWQEYDPVAPLDNAVQSQGKEQTEHQQAAIHYKLATTWIFMSSIITPAGSHTLQTCYNMNIHVKHYHASVNY